jgi:hypothetical protein
MGLASVLFFGSGVVCSLPPIVVSNYRFVSYKYFVLGFALVGLGFPSVYQSSELHDSFLHMSTGPLMGDHISFA